MSDLHVRVVDAPARSVEVKASTIPVGEVFFGRIGTYQPGVFLRAYGMVVCLGRPRSTWSIAERGNHRHGEPDHDALVKDYRPATSANLDVS